MITLTLEFTDTAGAPFVVYRCAVPDEQAGNLLGLLAAYLSLAPADAAALRERLDQPGGVALRLARTGR